MAAKPSFRRPFFAALAASIVVLALGASSALADPGSVYIDSNSNVGTGHDFWGGTSRAQDSTSAFGYSIMPNLTTGNFNDAIGDLALFDNTTGISNVGSGYRALQSNTTGIDNVASGVQALVGNTTGSVNDGGGLRRRPGPDHRLEQRRHRQRQAMPGSRTQSESGRREPSNGPSSRG